MAFTVQKNLISRKSLSELLVTDAQIFKGYSNLDHEVRWIGQSYIFLKWFETRITLSKKDFNFLLKKINLIGYELFELLRDLQTINHV